MRRYVPVVDQPKMYLHQRKGFFLANFRERYQKEASKPHWTLLSHILRCLQELLDHFFLALIRTQGEDTTEERSTAGVVPISEVPNILRALGFYPTEQVLDCNLAL